MPQTLPHRPSPSKASSEGRRRTVRTRTGLQLVAMAAVLAIVLVACSSDSPSAVTVGSTSISESSVDSALKTIAKNPNVKEKAVIDGKLQPSVVAAWLTMLVQTEVAKAANEKAGTVITQPDRSEAASWADGYFGNSETFAEFPKDFRDAAIERYANVPAYVRTHTKPPTDADVRTAYDESLARNCPSGRYLSHILVATEPEATAVAAEVAGGADFKTVAQSKSIDSDSGQRGGALGCIDGQQLDPTFSAAAAATAQGAVSPPFKTQFGWHIVKVEGVDTALPFDSVKAEIRTDLIEKGPEGRSALQKLMAAAKVKLVAKYGRWVVKDGAGRVEPRSDDATTTTTGAGSSSTTTTTTKP